MNYILQLNGVFSNFAKDSRLNPSHISLYMALFNLANTLHFPKEFQVDRNEMMRDAKIGSLTTYHKCIKELNEFKYVEYYPSHNRFRGSKIILINFCTSPKQVVNKSYTSSKQALVHESKHNTNNNKLNTNVFFKDKKKLKQSILAFFSNHKSLEFLTEIQKKEKATQFYNYYQSLGWKINGQTIEDWNPAADNWILKANTKNTESKTYLHSETKKVYDKPL